MKCDDYDACYCAKARPKCEPYNFPCFLYACYAVLFCGDHLLACILLNIFLPTFCLVYPECYTFPTGTCISVNGSYPTGNCSNVSMDDTMTTCLQPTSSVLFDGRVPTLTGLDGHMWAGQLLTMQTTQSRHL